MLIFAHMKRIVKITVFILVSFFILPMTALMMSPSVADVPMKLFIHETEAIIQFEAGSDVINADSCSCRNDGCRDNIEQLHMIDEWLNDSTKEIVDIKIVGNASPESSHIRNIEIAKRRSKTLVEYISRHYNLPESKMAYYYFPENWEGLRALAESSDDISEEQRSMLLDLIDSPASSHEEFDNKERILKTDPRYKGLYYGKILPEWFPNLRTATVTIRRRQKLLSDEKLMEMINSITLKQTD